MIRHDREFITKEQLLFFQSNYFFYKDKWFGRKAGHPFLWVQTFKEGNKTLAFSVDIEKKLKEFMLQDKIPIESLAIVISIEILQKACLAQPSLNLCLMGNVVFDLLTFEEKKNPTVSDRIIFFTPWLIKYERTKAY